MHIYIFRCIYVYLYRRALSARESEGSRKLVLRHALVAQAAERQAACGSSLLLITPLKGVSRALLKEFGLI